MGCIMSWVGVGNEIFVTILGQEFVYRNKKTNEETHYGFNVLENVSTLIGTRKKGITDTQILRAIQAWLPSKYQEERARLNYEQSRKNLNQAWNDDAKFLMRMAKSIVVSYRLRGAEIAEYLSGIKDWSATVNQWRHHYEYHRQLSKKQDYLTAFLEVQNRVLAALLWLQKNRQLIEDAINYQKDVDSFYYEILMGLPVAKIRSVAMEQIAQKRDLTDTFED